MAILTDADFVLLIARLGGSAVVSAADQNMIKLDFVTRSTRAVKDFVGFNVEQAAYTEFYPVGDKRSPEAPLARSSSFVSPLGASVLESGGVSELALKQRPLRSVTSVHENRGAWNTDVNNGTWTSDFLLAPGSDYVIDWDEVGLSMSAKLVREGTWSAAARTIRVVYTAGLTADELASERWSAFKDAVLLTIQAKYVDMVAMRQDDSGASGVGPLTSERIGDWAGSRSVAAIEHLFGLKSEIPPEAKAQLREFVSMGKYFAP